MTDDMIPRAEADTQVVAAYEAVEAAVLGVTTPHPYTETTTIIVEEHTKTAILRVIRALTPDDARAALEAMLAEAEKRGEKRGMLRAAEIARSMSFPIQDAANATCGLPKAADQVAAAIRAEAEE